MRQRAPALIGKLHRLWDERLQAQAGEIDANIKSLENHSNKLQSAADKYKEWNEELKTVKDRFEGCRRKVGAQLGREIGAEDEAMSLLNDEADRIESRLQELSTAVQEKQTRLSNIEKELEKIKIIQELLHLEAKQKIVEQIQQLSEYADLAACRDAAAELVDDLEAIRTALSEVANEEVRRS